MGFSPYIHFRGNCAEAMTFYAKLFNGTGPLLMRYSEAPPDAGMPASDLVMHAVINVPGGMLFGSDFPPGFDGDPQKAVSIVFEVKEVEEGRRIFDALKEGGTVIMDYQATFWAKGFGMLQDRFGTHWMISLPSDGQA